MNPGREHQVGQRLVVHCCVGAQHVQQRWGRRMRLQVHAMHVHLPHAQKQG